MEPAFLAVGARRLAAVFHPPARGPWLDLGVLLCPPIGRARHRSARAWTELAECLARAGAPCLQFDPTGCGDSSGSAEDGSLALWEEDALAAARELRAGAGVGRWVSCGLGLGAILALRAAASDAAAGAIAWNAPADGASHWRRLEQEDRAWRRHVGLSAPRRLDSGAQELLGFTYSARLRGELQGLLPRPLPRMDLLLLENDASGGAAAWSAMPGARSMRSVSLAPDPSWGEGGDLFTGAPLPPEVRDAACRFVAELACMSAS